MQSYNLGDTIERERKVFRLIRIAKQTSLHSDHGGQESVVEEDILEWKAEDGTLDFDVLSTTKQEYKGAKSSIKAPEPITWRRE